MSESGSEEEEDAEVVDLGDFFFLGEVVVMVLLVLQLVDEEVEDEAEEEAEEDKRAAPRGTNHCSKYSHLFCTSQYDIGKQNEKRISSLS